MFRPFIIRPSSGWIQSSEELHKAIYYNQQCQCELNGNEISFYKKLGGGVY